VVKQSYGFGEEQCIKRKKKVGLKDFDSYVKQLEEQLIYRIKAHL